MVVEQKTIMVCDDDQDILTIFERILSSKFSNIIVTSSGNECLLKYAEEVSQGNRIDALLLDYRLGDMLGKDVACKIKEMDGTKIVLITAYELEKQELEDLKKMNCIESDCKKPISPKNLIATISSGTNNNNNAIGSINDGFFVYAAKNSLEKFLGEEATKLVFKTLRVIYRIDHDAIATDPDLFEDALVSLFGSDAARIILRDISPRAL